MASSPAKTVTVICSDGEEFEIPINVIEQSKLIKNMIDDVDISQKFPLSIVNSATLAKVIEYCRKHADHGETGDDELRRWDDEFLKGQKCQVLCEIILAANYLDIKSLLDSSCQTVADMIKDKSVEEVRRFFNIKNDYSAKEEAQLRKENEWAFDI